MEQNDALVERIGLLRDRIIFGFKTVFVFLFLIILCYSASAQKPDEKPLYLDHTKPFKQRVDNLMSQMTLEEKLSQLITRIPADLTRFGIPGYLWGGEAGHCVVARANDYATIFPVGIAQAATWDKKTVWEVGNAMSDEARPRFHAGLEKSTLTFWAPVVEMARDPRWGRTEECYGEDPYLTSRLSLAFVRGIQGDHPKYLKAIACPKHYALNNEEWCRHNGSSDVDEQLLHEYYLKPYQVLVQEGKAEQIMASYNRVNGVPAIGNKKLLTDILRGEWGFDGTVVSDCTGIKDFYTGHKYVANMEEGVALALNAGMDLECGDCFKVALADVVKKGMVPLATIDSAVHRVLVSRFRLGLYDPAEFVPFTKIPRSVVDGPVNREVAKQSVLKSIVMLKNSGNMLPLDKNKIKTVAVIGPNAAVCQLGGYTGGYSKAVSPLQGIINKLDSTKVKYVKGTDIKITLPVIPTENLLPPDAKPGEHGLRGEYFSNTDFSGEPFLVRTDSVINFNFGKSFALQGMPIDYYSIRWTGSFIAPVSGPYYIGGDFDDAIRLYIDGKKLIDKILNRNTSSDAVKIEVEAGKKYDLRLEFIEQWYTALVKLGGAAPNPDKFKEAIAAATKADVAVVVLGTDESLEKEGVDRSDLNLPGDQEDLAKAISRANPKTIVILQNGSAMSVNWIDKNIPAIFETWYNGEEGGNAIADVIFGDYNPAGRLPLTFYKSSENFPSFSDYDIRKGRTYMYGNNVKDNSKISEVLYPFGYGLSYTRFSYGKLEVVSKNADASGNISAKITIKNVGKRTGDEVIQLYAHQEKSSVLRPEKQLVSFERITLQPNESKTVELVFPAKDLAIYDVNKKSFVVEPGIFKLMVGSSSADIKSMGEVLIK
jgi:beta-glucosidase